MNKDGTNDQHNASRDHQQWWNELCIWQQDVKDLELRSGTLLPELKTIDHRVQAEAFQNRMIREQEAIDELKHIVKTQGTSLDRIIPEATFRGDGRRWKLVA